jgi:ATP-dependent Clp protease ATP-binding subunit ClpC
MKLTPRCQQTIDHAKAAAARLAQPSATSAHLVLGLLKLSGGCARNVLKGGGLTSEMVNEYLTRVGQQRPDSAPLYEASLSATALTVLNQAECEAKRFQHTLLGVEHLALALLHEEHGEAAEMFASTGVDRPRMREEIERELK